MGGLLARLHLNSARWSTSPWLYVAAGALTATLLAWSENVLCGTAQCSFAMIVVLPAVAGVACFALFVLAASGRLAQRPAARPTAGAVALTAALAAAVLGAWIGATSVNHLVCHSAGSLSHASFSMLEVVTRDVEAAGVRYSLISGALLGAVRTGRLIPHDLDIDIYILPAEENWRRFRELRSRWLADGVMMVEGNEITSHSLRLSGVPPLFGSLQWSALDYYNDIEVVEDLVGKRTEQQMQELLALLSDLGQCTVEGFVLPCPRNVERYLEINYGPTWRVPSRGRRGDQLEQTTRGYVPSWVLTSFCDYFPVL